jgi:flagellar hook-associated protein 3 FlgL
MRVTTAGQTQTIIARLQTASQRLAAAQQRAVSGRRIETLSDDPTAGAALMQVAGGLRGVTQYARNVDRLKGSLDAEDSVLQQLGDLTARARELGVAANSASSSASARAASAQEVRGLLLQATALGNTRFGDGFLFGGMSNDGRPPFAGDAAPWVPTDPPPAGSPPGTPAAPRYPAGELAVEAGAGGQRLLGPHDGTRVLLGRAPDGSPDPGAGVLPALRALLDALEGGVQADVGAALGVLERADAALQATVGDVGARQNHADALTTGLAALSDTLTRQQSDLGEVDAEEAITEMLSRQTAYQAAMLASSKVMGVSLADYLR